MSYPISDIRIVPVPTEGKYPLRLEIIVSRSASLTFIIYIWTGRDDKKHRYAVTNAFSLDAKEGTNVVSVQSDEFRAPSELAIEVLFCGETLVFRKFRVDTPHHFKDDWIEENPFP